RGQARPGRGTARRAAPAGRRATGGHHFVGVALRACTTFKIARLQDSPWQRPGVHRAHPSVRGRREPEAAGPEWAGTQRYAPDDACQAHGTGRASGCRRVVARVGWLRLRYEALATRTKSSSRNNATAPDWWFLVDPLFIPAIMAGDCPCCVPP